MTRAGPTGHLVAFDHVQLAMPSGPVAEAEAEAFCGGPLGLRRVPKPPHLAARGGCWFEGAGGSLRVHLGVEEPFRPARKAHPAFAVAGVEVLVGTCRSAGFAVRRVETDDGPVQWYVDDPFGNRIELVEAGPDRRDSSGLMSGG